MSQDVTTDKQIKKKNAQAYLFFFSCHSRVRRLIIKSISIIIIIFFSVKLVLVKKKENRKKWEFNLKQILLFGISCGINVNKNKK